MTGSRLMHWILCGLVAAVGVAGCSTDTTKSGESTGSLDLNLELAPGVVINEVKWVISRALMDDMMGTIDTSAPGATASVEVFGLPPGDGYTVTLSAKVEGEDTDCVGSADFSVTVGVSIPVKVMLNCKRPERLGGVRVNGKFNICADLAKVVVSPLETSVGNQVDLSALGIDVDDDNDMIKYLWSASPPGGDIADPTSKDTTYTCGEAGLFDITIRITDDEWEYCMDEWTVVDVKCVEGDGGNLCDDVPPCDDTGNECTEAECKPLTGKCEISDRDGEDCDGGDGICVGDDCQPKDLCIDKPPCDDTDCTDGVCVPATGNCVDKPINEGQDCDNATGICNAEGECIPKATCEDEQCPDTGSDCTVSKCNILLDKCVEMNVPDNTDCLVDEIAGKCSDGDCIVSNECEPDPCISTEQCVQDGTCDPADGSCTPGGNEPEGERCDLAGIGDGVCDGEGTCNACNVGGDCPGEVGQCEMKSCIANACGTAPGNEGDPCDLEGIGDGRCMGGDCVEPPQCDDQNPCPDDGNDCTTVACIGGNCVSGNESEGEPCQGEGDEKLCDGQGMCVECLDPITDCLDDGNKCTVATCNSNTCGTDNASPNKMCDLDSTDDGFCDDSGTCVECNINTQCQDDENECTEAACQVNVCGQSDVSDSTSCNEGNGECQSGVCEPLGPPTFDLAGEFRAYNSLLKGEGDPISCVGVPPTPGVSKGGPIPPGPEVGTCTVPDLTQVPGSTTGFGVGIDTQCISTPGITGQLTFDDDGAGNVTMDGTLGLGFTIDAIVDLSAPACTLILQAVISTDSSNAISGSGTGSVSDGGSVTLADLGGANAGFNVNYTSSGTVTCAAEPPAFAGQVCNLAGGLVVGNNALPLPGDPGVRFWPVVTFQDNQPADGKLEMQYATGPTTIAGWAMNNPPSLASPGTQFIATTGVQQ